MIKQCLETEVFRFQKADITANVKTMFGCVFDWYAADKAAKAFCK